MLEITTRGAALVATVALALFPTACKKKGDGGGGAWLVGEDGAMFNVSRDLSVGNYGLDVALDFRDIVCLGESSAWVVGDGGLAMRTFDQGASWTDLDLGTTSALHGIAVSDAGVVYAAGDGVARVSRDYGDSWGDVDLPARDWRAVSTNFDGNRAVFADDHSVWLRIGDAAELVYDTETAIRDVAMSTDGRYLALVGDGGLVAVSDDGGSVWRALPIDTTADLHGVWRTGDGELWAVGSAGTLVRIAGGTHTVETLADATLRDLHLDLAGVGTLVGDGGTVLVTDDGGASWTSIDVGTNKNLHAVDDLHIAPHL